MLIGALVIFFFYASSPNLDESEYSEIKRASYKYNSKDTLTIITYNLGYFSGMTNGLPVAPDPTLFDENEDRFKNITDQLDPDFIAFQEIDFDADRSLNRDQLSWIQDKGAFSFASKVVNWDKKYVPFPYLPIKTQFGKLISGQAIVSKYPILENNRIKLIKPINAPFYYNKFYLDRMLQINKVKIGIKELIIMNVHLEAFDQETREAQSLIVLAKFNELSDKYPVILLGDFNALPSGENEDMTIPTIMKGKNIVRSIPNSVYQINKSKYYTFDSKEPTRKIDYILYNKDKIRGIEARVIKEADDISDHIPIMMRFSIL